MRNIEEFIDQQVLRDSKELTFINSLILETVNKGNASELITCLAIPEILSDVLKKSKYSKDALVTLEDQDLNSKALNYLEGSQQIFNSLKQEADSVIRRLLNTTFFRKEYLEEDNSKIKIENAKVKFSGKELSGKSSSDAEIIFNFIIPQSGKKFEKNFRISLKRGNTKVYGSSRFVSRGYIPNLPSSEKVSAMPAEPNQTLVKQRGGGPIKIFSIFGFSGDKELEKNLSKVNLELGEIYDKYLEDYSLQPMDHISDFEEKDQKRKEFISSLYENFAKYMESELSEESSGQILKLINIFLNLTTRSDKEVKAYIDVKSTKELGNLPTILFTPLMEKYCGHIKKVTVSFNKEKNPHVTFSIPYDGVNFFENHSLNNTIHKNIYLYLKDIVNRSISLNKKYEEEASIDKEKQYKLALIQDNFTRFGLTGVTLMNSDKQADLDLLYYQIVQSANEIIKTLQGVNLYNFSYKFSTERFGQIIAKKREEESKYRIEFSKLKNKDISYKDFRWQKIRQKYSKELEIEDEEIKREGDSIFSTAGVGFKKYALAMIQLYELEKNDNSEVKEIIKLINKVLTSIRKEVKPVNENIEKLILEQLDQREFSKVMKKVSSSGAKGLISAVPSNKTANTIAVRFDADESIDSGIKKVKSSLRSSGYDLEDNRVLKFDQKRDTTDVIKNGEVVARLFFRADIKERKGLAYEHIIGAVLTKKITPQLKNRIDLPPDASKEQVMEKLRSEEFGKLFQSAKKAAPLIIQKVGNIISAESVGSTNNKADFVLKTDQGKTIGLSAKYATGEKDNEYKMNKVLGFGTEEDSLVYNPKGVPWWIVGRKTFLKKLKDQTSSYSGREYDPDPEDLDAPAWMKTAKESNPEIYKETMEEVYGAIRNILASNLKKLGLKGLIAFANEADLGKEEERENYDMFLKVMDGPSGLSVTEISLDGVDTDNINNSANLDQIVVQDRSDIIIRIPGHDELKINSVKFKSDMLSSKAGDLKIKTR